MQSICQKCQRSVKPKEKVVKDKKKRWLITYCEYERCGFNFDIEEIRPEDWPRMHYFYED